jgi:uncharacterized protein
MPISVTSAVRSAADWYPDPVGVHEFRYWDGERWTDGVANAGVLSTEPLAPLPVLPQRVFTGLPARAAWFALLGVVAGSILGGILVAIGWKIAGHLEAVQLALAQVGLWAGLLGACWLASRRYGTGHIRSDLHLRFERRDIRRGFLAGLLARVVTIALGAGLYLIDHRITGSHAAINGQLRSTSVGLVIVAVVIALGAPLFEELFFRGLIMQSLQTRWGPRVALGGQAIAFGVAHLSPDLGLGNIGEMLVITTVGLILGWLAQRYRRLGPGVWAHGWFNLGSTLLLLTT